MAYLGQKIGKLGFGAMRLPKKGEEIDVEQTKQMVDHFLAAGFTYFDTAWAYPGSEDALRQALVERYPRESYQLATKNAAWYGCKTREEAINQFETSLKLTGAGYIDYYLLHNLGEGRTRAFNDFNMWDFVQEKKREGLIKHVGFSFHSTADELEPIFREHPEMEFVQLQINYADWESPSIQSRACYELARKYNVPVIVMEPVKGGMLAQPPEPVAEILRQANPNASLASWAVRYAAGLEGIITVLSGMSSLEQMDDNISYMRDFVPLSKAEQDVIGKAQEALAKVPHVPCTSCDYCAKVCPAEVGISGTFTGMNIVTVYKHKKLAKDMINWRVDGAGKKRADACVQCGECEKVCPQHIAIRDELARSGEVLSGI